MSKVIGMYDKAAERTARRELPSVELAKQILEGTTREEILEIAARGFRDPASLSPDEYLLLLADRRVYFEQNAR